jgi:ABC-2 type transport system permease protein
MSAVARLGWIELKLLVREPFTLLFVFVFPLVILLVQGGIFGSEPEEAFGGASPVDYYVAGYIGTVIAALALVGIPVHLAMYRERGILRRLTASAISSQTVLLSQLLVGVIMAATGALILVAATAVIYGVGSPVSTPGVLISFLLGSVSFVMFGLFLGVLLPTARSAQAIGLGLFFPLWMLSGAGPPPEVMTDTMVTISNLLPMTHLVKALQASWIGNGIDYGELAILFGILGVSGAGAMWRARSFSG